MERAKFQEAIRLGSTIDDLKMLEKELTLAFRTQSPFTIPSPLIHTLEGPIRTIIKDTIIRLEQKVDEL